MQKTHTSKSGLCGAPAIAVWCVGSLPG